LLMIRVRKMSTSSLNKTPKMTFVKKGWGYEKWIVNKSEYCGKLLFFEKGKRCSWHYHKLKDEVFYVQSGKLLVKYGLDDDIKKAEEIILNRGDNFYIYSGLRHQMLALETTELFEFSTEHFDEDSYRVIKGD
jgi:quercetin dioxygenase-like cupin family protein